ncbi:MAG: hypothetical protein ACFE9Q_00710 [Candidatus Hodarchaeota archaeon]
MSKTPVRIAFGGGGTDIEPYSSDYEGYVVNITIDKYIKCELTKQKDNRINIYSNDKFSNYHLRSIQDISKIKEPSNIIEAVLQLMCPKLGLDINIDVEPPKQAGLGASASLSTALIAGLLKIENKEINPNKVAEKGYYVEQYILKNEGGRQDQYAAVYGGLNSLIFSGNSNVKVEKLKISDSFLKKIEKNLLLYYTGESHTSGDMVRRQVKSYIDDKEQSKRSLDKLKGIAYEIRDSLISENYERFGKLLAEDLQEKTQFNPFLTTDYMKHLDKVLMKNGAIGGRVCGAGGGGCMIWLLKPDKNKMIRQLLKRELGNIISYKFVHKGLELLEV